MKIPHNQLNKVQKWFLEHKDELMIGTRGSDLRTKSQELILPFFEKEPDWDKFHVYQFPDGREVYEINLANAQVYYPASLKDSLPNTAPSVAVIQNIMFVENKQNGRFDPIIARYYPNNEASIRDFEEIYYNKIDLAWSGVLDLWTYDERHFVGFNIVEGDLISSFTYDKGEDANARKNIGGENLLTVDCFRVAVGVEYTYSPYGEYGQTVVTTTRYSTICSGGGSSGGGAAGEGASSGNYTYSGGGYGYTEGSSANTNPVTYAPPRVPAPAVFEINMKGLSPCHQDIIKGLIGGTQQEFRRIFDKFNGNYPVPTSLNVKFQYGNCNGTGATACTDPKIVNGFSNIYINQTITGNATDLSMARTIMHEMLHAYLLFERNYPSDCDLNSLLNEYINKYGGDNLNPSHHNLFVETKFLNDISIELKNYATSIGYNVNVLGNQFFLDMAWGGLHTTDVFIRKTITEQNRIKATVKAEMTGESQTYGSSNASPQGIPACD